MILVACLDAVVTVAKALPVVLIPEKNLVSSVWYDMIHISRLDVASLLHALHTQWMPSQGNACMLCSMQYRSLGCLQSVCLLDGGIDACHST